MPRGFVCSYSIFTLVMGLSLSNSVKASAQPLFPDFGFDFNGRISSSAIGDLNGDGISDIALANWWLGNVSIFLGIGEGEFSTQQDYSVRGQPERVFLEDFNLDGKLDLVSLSTSSDSLTVFLGVGDGALTNRRDYFVGEDPTSLVIVDINSDGLYDLLTANRSSGNISILPGTGDGLFSTRLDVNVGPFPICAEAVDLDNDGDLDLIGANGTTLYILKGNASGNFEEPIQLATGDNPWLIDVKDLNGDGILDVVTANRQSNTISVLLGNGDGTFGTAQHLQSGEFPIVVIANDLNDDHLQDIVIVNRGTTESAASISVLLGLGDGTFGPRQDYAGGLSPRNVAVEDINGDSILDLIVSDHGGVSPSNNRLLILLGNGDGSFQGRQQYPTGGGPAAAASGDLNMDGYADLVVPNVAIPSENGFTASIFINTGNGTFTLGPTLDIGTGKQAVIADFDADGANDIAIAKTSPALAAVFMGNGDGTFTEQQDFVVSNNGLPRSLVTADFNEDGFLDLALANSQGDSVSILLGDGTGNFSASEEFEVAEKPMSLAVRDFDTDGHLDLVTANQQSDSISVLLGDGTGQFPVRSDYIVGDHPLFVASDDLDADGFFDLVVLNSQDSTVSLLFGDGKGSFSDRQDISITSTGNVAIADFDGDGNLDISIATPARFSNPDAIVLLMGLGNRKFETRQFLHIGDNPSVTSGDFDDNGTPDLAVTNASSDTLEVLLNLTIAVAPCPTDVTNDNTINLADLNLVLANFGQTTPDGDTNNDGEVNLADLNAVLAAFGTDCP